jgi:hypothetical protein
MLATDFAATVFDNFSTDFMTGSSIENIESFQCELKTVSCCNIAEWLSFGLCKL